jgi:hypothetical protein
MGYVYQGEAIAHLGLANHDELYAFTTPLRDARLVGTGIGVIRITPKGEEYLMDPTERQELRQRLIAELEQEIGRKARDEVELAKYVAAYTGKPPSSSGVKSFSDTWELASQMGVDPYKLRAIALVLKEEGVAEVMSVMHDRVGVRLKKVDVKIENGRRSRTRSLIV